jgi:cytochrome c553
MRRKASITSQPRRFAVSEAAAKRKSQDRVGVRVCSLAMIFMAGIAPAALRYTDLRSIEPIHGDLAAGERKAAVCHACHGVGASVAPTFPRLAGQRPDYLYHRLVSFKTAGGPKDPYYSQSPMRPLAANLSDADMRDLAVYYAAQTPTAANVPDAPAAMAGKGEALFLAGDPPRGIPPCQGCHGADARGAPIATGQYAAYPSLRGQYSTYLVARLMSFHDNLPHDTTNDFIMGGVAVTLDDDSIRAIAAWLSSLTPSRSL